MESGGRAPHVGRLGGRRPGYDEEQFRWVHTVKARNPTWGPDTISRLSRATKKPVTPKQVRGILAKPLG